MDADKARSRDSSEPQWEELKGEINWLYLVNNCTIAEIQQKLEQKYGFKATPRKYKTRLKRWGFDQKKIDCWLWNALNLVMQDKGRRCKFHVPIRDGHSCKDITPEEVTKQWKRAQRSEKWKIYAQKNPNCNDLSSAYHMLSANAVVIEELDPAPFPGRSSYTALPQSSNRRPVEALEPDLTVSDDSLSLSSSPSELSPRVAPSANISTSYYPTQVPRFIGVAGQPPSEEQERQWDRLPSVRTLIKDIERSALPQIPGIEHATPVRIMDPIADRYSSQFRGHQDYDDLTQMLANFAIDPKHTIASRGDWEKFLGVRATSTPQASQNAEQHEAVEWAAYYVQQCLAGFETLDARNHPDRMEAMGIFRKMVRQHNRWVFSYLNWLMIVLGASDKPEQVQECLEDCCTSVDACPVPHAWIYNIGLRLLLADHQNNRQEISHYGSQLEHKLQQICEYWGEKSANHLVIRNQYACYLLDQDRADEARLSLLQWLPVSRQAMGSSHLITINSLSLLSRSYDRLGQTDAAISYLQLALKEQSGPSRPLQAYHHRLLRRLAGLQIRAGQIPEAEYALQTVLSFRISMFTITHRVTWNVIHQLIELLESQGRREEAEKFNSEMLNLFYREQAQSYISSHGHSPPWLKSTNDED